MQTAWAFVVALALLISIHEYGHYRVAVACGVRVLRFSIGFGPVIWRYKPRHPRPGQDTEFVVCLLPLGGYVKMLDEREGPVDPDLKAMAFNQRPLRQRAAIVAAGPLANLLLAVLLFAGAHLIGVQEPRAILAAPPTGSAAQLAGLNAGDEVMAVSVDGAEPEPVDSLGDLRWHVAHAPRDVALSLEVRPAGGRDGVRRSLTLPPLDSVRNVAADAGGGASDAALVEDPLQALGLSRPFTPPVLVDVVSGAAAHQAGLQKGDRVLAIGPHAIEDGAQLRERIRQQFEAATGQARSAVWRVQRDGQTLEVSVLPTVVHQDGIRVAKVGVMVGGMPEMVLVRRGPWDALVRGVEQTWQTSALTVRMIGQMLVGQASLKNLSGPLSIADYAGKSATLGAASYVMFMAMLSVSLGVLNLLPLPILDGGHLLYYLWEALTGRAVSDAWQMRLQQVGLVMLLGLMSIAVFNDVLRLWG